MPSIIYNKNANENNKIFLTKNVIETSFFLVSTEFKNAKILWSSNVTVQNLFY